MQARTGRISTPASSFHLTSHGSTGRSHDGGVLSAGRICAIDSSSPLEKSNFTPVPVQSRQQQQAHPHGVCTDPCDGTLDHQRPPSSDRDP